MRPVNLIPVERRRDERRPMRGGPLAYIVIGALVAALLGVTMLVITGNQISESKAEITQLEGEKAAIDAKVATLSAYTSFHSVREQRMATVASLADSRFDWERVMRELSLVLPTDVWLSTLTGSANPSVVPDGAAGIALRASIPGPALEIVGCGRSQDAVAGFVQALKDIDGVTRVGVQSSELGEQTGEDESGGSEAATAACQTRKFIAQFQIVAAFDAAPVASETAPEAAVVPPAESTETSTEAE
ncbi:MAG TPA: PilN domain-containing protein [Solirubrobacterales bacterium]|nr:PilN domain-containing protein [Solirubrobacterales bacterium]